MTDPINPYDAPEPERRGMSGTTKVLLGFGIGCGLLLVICCGVFGVGGMWVLNYAQNSISEDPAKVRDVTADIVAIEIPKGLEPKAVFDMHVPFSGERLMTWVSYESTQGDNHLVLGQFGASIAKMGDFESQLRKSIDESRKDKDEDVDVVESETFDSKINDENAQFKISQTTGRTSKKEYWDVIGQFRGNAGPAMIMIRLDSAEFTKEQLLDVLKSMN